MEVFALEQFKKIKASIIPMTQFHSRLSGEIGQYTMTTTMHIRIFLRLLLSKGLIDSLLTTMWYHTDG